MSVTAVPVFPYTESHPYTTQIGSPISWLGKIMAHHDIGEPDCLFLCLPLLTTGPSLFVSPTAAL